METNNNSIGLNHLRNLKAACVDEIACLEKLLQTYKELENWLTVEIAYALHKAEKESGEPVKTSVPKYKGIYTIEKLQAATTDIPPQIDTAKQKSNLELAEILGKELADEYEKIKHKGTEQ